MFFSKHFRNPYDSFNVLDPRSIGHEFSEMIVICSTKLVFDQDAPAFPTKGIPSDYVGEKVTYVLLNFFEF